MNNASVDASGVHVADLEFSDFERAIRSNFFGQVLCCKHFIRRRKENSGGGKIINVTSIHEDIPNPGRADYDCTAIDDPDLLEKQVQSIPLKRAAQPEEIAKLALFLAASESDYVTGWDYIMDGGLMRSLGQGA